MKVKELLLEGNWNIQNLSGVMKKFKDNNSTEAKAWMKTRGTGKFKWDPHAKEWVEQVKAPTDRELDREDARYERERRNRMDGKHLDLLKVYNKVIDVIGETFPDVDPIDNLKPWLERQGVSDLKVHDVIDRALKKHGSSTERKGMYEYLAVMWEEMARDRIHDAKNGHIDNNSVFYDIENEGDEKKIVMNDNPWLGSDEQKKIRAKYEKERSKFKN